MKKYILILVFFLAISSLFVPISALAEPEVTLLVSLDDQSRDTQISTSTIPLTDERAQIGSWPTPDKIRVAFYNETNTTNPDYAVGVSGLSNNYTHLQSILTEAGYHVDLLTFQDILDHKLTTANYDVFVMADNLPRENITDLVKDFWLGGGGMLSFDHAANFIAYAGVIPEAEGTHSFMDYWVHWIHPSEEIVARHPITQAYEIGDRFSYDTSQGYVVWNWSLMQESKVGADLVRLGTPNITNNIYWNVTNWAMDSTQRGGRVVQLSYYNTDNATALNYMADMIKDAVNWLTPRPKGRILIDYSHQPYYVVDSWDEVNAFKNKYSTWRDALVNRSYTVDKLYPSVEGNLTQDNLVPYDLLISVLPGLNYSAAEVASVTDWILNGGGLLALGDRPFSNYDDHLNYLLSNTDLAVNLTVETTNDVMAYSTNHPTKEATAILKMINGGFVNYAGSAFPIYGNNASHITVAGQELGNGRIILAGDINMFDVDHIIEAHNSLFAVNVVNWLTSGDAKVLVYADTNFADPNSNVYRGPVAQALNDLGVPFYLTFQGYYFNLSLNLESWDLVIVDNLMLGMSSYFPEILEYVEGGGKLIINTWLYGSASGEPLWDYMGFSYAGPTFSPPPTIYLWDTAHEIFNMPNNYGAENISTNLDFLFGSECANLTLHANGTGLAGLGTPPSVTNASIILGPGGRTIANGMLLTTYMSDMDDSTYADAVELWENEIAYLLPKPLVDSPADVVYSETETGNSITWAPTSIIPESYQITGNGTTVETTPWDGGAIVVVVDGLSPGLYNYTIIITDRARYSVSDTVWVTVYALPTVDHPADINYTEGTTGNAITWTPQTTIPAAYEIFQNGGSVEANATWDGSAITYVVDGLSIGAYNYTLVVEDTRGFTAADTVIVTVSAIITSPTTPTTTPPTTPTTTPPTTPTATSTPGFLVVVILIALIVLPTIRLAKKQRK